ncbi:MAG: DHA2 family efflux MFS transporter permease subunit [Desulfuromonadales bacterium]|nr:DHA2 family efflux MFS transporter permease subunit [Desulfuromonadales bacterium]
MSRPVKHVNKWIIAISVMLPTIMEIIDTAVANVALPHIQGSLNAGADEVTWVLTSYLVSNAVVLPMTGWLSRTFGRKRFLMTCIVIFTMASFFCGMAPSLAALIFFRVVQGAAGGALVPTSQSVMMETFPPSERGMAMAIFGIGVMFGPIIGPALGGWITDNTNWRWIFYINIPIGIIAIIMAYTFIFDPPYMKHKKDATIDYIGLLLLTVGLGSLQIVLDKGQRDDWFSSSFIIGFSIISAISIILLIYTELRNKHPIVNLRLFKNPSFSVGTLIIFVLGFCLYSSITLIPMLLQTIMGYDATMAGLVLAPGGVANLVAMPFVGAALQKYDSRKLIFCGISIASLSMFLMQKVSLDAAYFDFAWPRIILGLGLAMTFVPLTTTAFAEIPNEEMANATGMYNLLRNMGGSVGIAISSTMVTRNTQFYQTQLVAHANDYNPVFHKTLQALKQAMIIRGIDPVTAENKALGMIYGNIQKQAAMLSYNRIFWIVGVSFIVIMPLLLLLKKPSRANPPANVH